MARITYYDFSNVEYAGFFINGLFQNARRFGYRMAASKRAPAELADLELTTKWLSVMPAILLLRYESANHSYLFCTDAGDASGSYPELPGYYLPLLERCRYYFKVNYNQAVIDADPVLRAAAHKILPANNVFSIRPSPLWPFLPHLAPLGNGRWPYATIKRRLRRLSATPSLDWFRRLRHVPQDLDLFFVLGYYATEKHIRENEHRLAIMEALREHSHLNAMVGFAVADDKPLPPRYEPFRLPRMDFQAYLKQLARAKIGLYVRGTWDCLSFKFAQMLVMGKPIVGQPLFNNREVLYRYDFFDQQFAYEAPDELVDRLIYLLAHPVEMDRLREANLNTFETYLTPEAVVDEMLTKIM